MTAPSSDSPLSYKQAGVDIDAGNALVERIKPAVKATRRDGVLGGLGGFGGLFELPWERYRRPVLVSGTDGVGTKLKLAVEAGEHDAIGIDLVAMCVNDIVVTGAEPLFFLDYYATGKLDVDVASDVITGIAEGCRRSGAALIGGETAEMPGMYAAGDYDLAGFAVGLVEKDAIIDGAAIEPGDVVIALASSGPHSNGYSLIRRILQQQEADPDQPLGETSLREALLAPTRIYVQPLLRLFEQTRVKGLAHITGGGLPENLPRILPASTHIVLDRGSWQWPEVFRWLQAAGNVSDSEMLRTFNCGVGMTLVVAAADAEAAVAILNEAGEQAWQIGEVVAGDGRPGVTFRE